MHCPECHRALRRGALRCRYCSARCDKAPDRFVDDDPVILISDDVLEDLALRLEARRHRREELNDWE